MICLYLLTQGFWRIVSIDLTRIFYNFRDLSHYHFAPMHSLEALNNPELYERLKLSGKNMISLL